MKTRNGKSLETVEEFKYLGAWTSSSEKDFNTRKGQAWTAEHKLRRIWTSRLSRNTKIRLFVATVESVLLYGSETWAITKRMEKSINGCYTRMLRMALNIPWQQHPTNEMLYGNLPKVSDKIRERRLRLAGHCVRHPEEQASNLILWEPKRGFAKRRRRNITFLDNIKADTGLDRLDELRNVMKDRKIWKDYVISARVGTRPK
ncbi:MAG: hypothetical protein MK200_06655 [Nitrosopumilus sp.]|nr:hypothetical protein [Nitrosopumilus sp.]